MDVKTGERLLSLRAKVVANFDAGNWEEIGLLTGESNLINNHQRLLRSLAWNDEDYAGNVLTVLRMIVERNPDAWTTIESYVSKTFPGESTYVSAKPAEHKITFAPYVFRVPDPPLVDEGLVAVMMPFAMEFDPVYASIKETANGCVYQCLRADKIWEDESIVQDVFNLIFRAKIIVVDFTGKNPNVMYETGIAHTLGKHVIPITQSLDDVPFDMRHHRALKYLNNAEGLAKLEKALSDKFVQIRDAWLG